MSPLQSTAAERRRSDLQRKLGSMASSPTLLYQRVHYAATAWRALSQTAVLAWRAIEYCLCCYGLVCLRGVGYLLNAVGYLLNLATQLSTTNLCSRGA